MFGLLTWKAFEHDPIQLFGVFLMLVGVLPPILYLSYKKSWKKLWTDWITTLDPKKIGLMYLLISLLMLYKGFADALMMRIQQVWAVGGSQGYLTADHFQQVFTAHGTTMIFFVGMGFIFSFMNLVIPLQIGARDVAYPFLNSISFWFFAVGAGLLIVSMIIGDFSTTGWVAYPPLSGIEYSPGVGVDYWIWSVQIAGVGSLLAGLNFFVTILKMRCPGMTLMKMPLYTWTVLATLFLVLFAFPILTATLGMLTLDRYLGMHFFTPDFGGNPMMYINLIWAWGHPEVYILILPAFGVYSEVVATFSEKRLFGYTSMVWAIGAITVLSFIVWLHHFFTMGAGAHVNAFFGVMTMLIAIPTGVKIFNWLFTMFHGRVRLTTPILWFLGFVFIFTTGGMTGMLLSIAPVDYQVHNSLFLIAHFHSMVIGGVLFGLFAAVTYWFPKYFGFKLNERLGKCAFWCWFVGFNFAFMPLYVLGFMGATRRLDHYDVADWHPLFTYALFGALLIGCGIAFQIMEFVVSIRQRKENRDETGDPWNGRTLEWSIPSPPPFYNFAVIPEVHDHDAFWAEKHSHKHHVYHYEGFHLPENSSIGFWIGVCSFLLGFGMTWRIWWMAATGLVGIPILMIIRLSQKHTEYYISAEKIKELHHKEKRWNTQ